jgi:hypothetical protein
MKFKKLLIPILLIFIPIIMAAIPLFGSGYIPTHDGEYHIIRFMDFFRMLSTGHLFPRWAPTMNSGFGIPIFNFQYPLPNYVGSLLHLFGFNFVISFQIAEAMAYILSALFCYFWLYKLFDRYSAVVGTILAAFVPYWFVDIYVRGSIGEVWAFTFVFAALAVYEYGQMPLVSLSILLLILSHNIMTMIFLPIIVLYIILKNPKALWWVLLGIFMLVYFIIPALMEEKYVVGLNTVNFREHFADLVDLLIPSWGTGLSGKAIVANRISYQIGIIPLLTILIGSVFTFIKSEKTIQRKINIMFLIITAVCLFLMTRISLSVWNLIKPLQLIQYPWRLLSVLIPTTAILGGYVTFMLKRKWLMVIVMFLAIGLTYSYTRPAIYTPRDDVYYGSRENFTDGTSSMGNSFSTIWTGWIQNRASQSAELVNGNGSIILTQNGYTDKKYTLNLSTVGLLKFNTLYYPGWHVYEDGSDVAIQNDDGFIYFQTNAGVHDIKLVFQETTIRKISDFISIIALAVLGISGILFYTNRVRRVDNKLSQK